MVNKARITNLAQQKQMLAEKYDRLIKTISSKPRRISYQRQAAKYHRQALELQKLAKA